MINDFNNWITPFAAGWITEEVGNGTLPQSALPTENFLCPKQWEPTKNVSPNNNTNPNISAPVNANTNLPPDPYGETYVNRGQNNRSLLNNQMVNTQSGGQNIGNLPTTANGETYVNNDQSWFSSQNVGNMLNNIAQVLQQRNNPQAGRQRGLSDRDYLTALGGSLLREGVNITKNSLFGDTPINESLTNSWQDLKGNIDMLNNRALGNVTSQENAMSGLGAYLDLLK